MGVVIVEWEGAVLGVNFVHTIVINRDFATWLFPNYFAWDSFVPSSPVQFLSRVTFQ